MRNRWIVSLFLLLAICALCAVAQGEEILLDAAEGADLSARLSQTSLAEGDTLVLRGIFASGEATFAEKIHVVIEEGGAVYGALSFPRGGALTGRFERSLPRVYGGVRAGDSFSVSGLTLYGFLHLGEADEEEEGNGDPWREDVRLQIDGTVWLLTGEDECSLYSMGGIVITESADLQIVNAHGYGRILRGANLRIGDFANLTVRGEMTYPYAGVDIAGDIEIGEHAFVDVAVRSDSCGIRGKSIAVEKGAHIYAEGSSCYGEGISASQLRVGENVRIEAQGPHGGITIHSFSHWEEDEDEWITDHLDIDPSALINASSILFDGNFTFTRPVVFEYTTAEPPALYQELDEYRIVGYREYYLPVRVYYDDDGDVPCCPPPPVGWRERDNEAWDAWEQEE